MVPASALQLHPHATVIIDEPAATELRLGDYYRETYRNKPTGNTSDATPLRTHIMDNPIEFVLGSFSGTTIDDATHDQLVSGMTGVTLFREDNVRDLDQVVELCAALHRACGGDLPAIVAVDQEGGQLQTMSGIVTDFPGNMALAATGDLELAGRVGFAVGSELRALGVNVNYAPVCDLLRFPPITGSAFAATATTPTAPPASPPHRSPGCNGPAWPPPPSTSPARVAQPSTRTMRPP